MQSTRLDDHFYNIVVSWQLKLPSIKNKHLLFCIAIDYLNNDIKKMTKDQLQNFDKELLKLCKKWADEGKIIKHPRGIGGK